MRGRLRSVLAISSLLMAWQGSARAQAFERAPVLTLAIGLLAPSGSMSDSYDPGILGRVGFRGTITQGTAFGLEFGIYAPNNKSGVATLYQYPLRALLYFPLAAEASSTPYVALGPGVTFSKVDNSGPPGSSTERDPYFSYALKVGWAFRPEHMSTLFEIGARYEQQFIGNADDLQTFDLEASVGRTF